jgi:hypothetical protein
LASDYFVRLVASLFAAKKKAHQPFAALGDYLRCFLLLQSLWMIAQVAGLYLNDCIDYFTAPYWAPLPL